jgi:hypothetical protein
VHVPCVPLQTAQVAPPDPHALSSLVPATHAPPEQHPVEHEVCVHSHDPLTQASPSAHEPLAQVPPQPSSAPHACPVQFGVHPQAPVVPPPPHVSGDAHAVQLSPAVPHSPLSAPLAQLVPLQQPRHEVLSHMHAPDTQCCPLAHDPVAQVPPQPSLAPHA